MISDNINAKATDILNEAQAFNDGTINTTPIADEVVDKSIQAILGGNKSQAWIDYMTLFTTPKGDDQTIRGELDRLIPRDGTDTDSKQQKARAYLVANGVCGMGTGHNLPNNVGNRLD